MGQFRRQCQRRQNWSIVLLLLTIQAIEKPASILAEQAETNWLLRDEDEQTTPVWTDINSFHDQDRSNPFIQAD